jgi:flagellar biosynthesis protein FlhB
MENKESKTENPTEKKLNDLLEKGNYSSSKEVSILFSIFVFTVYIANYFNNVCQDILTHTNGLIEFHIRTKNANFADLYKLLQNTLSNAAIKILPLLAALFISGILSSVVQNAPKFVVDRVKPKISNISALSGWKKIYSKKGFEEYLKSLAKFFVIIGVTLSVMYANKSEFVFPSVDKTGSFVELTNTLIVKFLNYVILVIFIFACADLYHQKISWWKNQKMTLQEVKDEIKQSEGDPSIKSRIRALGRSRVRNRMMKAVPTATFIVANPTHIAIAMRFDRARDSAPVVLAVGADILALRIREIASEHAIPVIENIELARSLYKVVKVEQLIPPQFYQAIAEIIRFLER